MTRELEGGALGKRSSNSVSSPMSAGSGQFSPASWARRRYSATVLWEMEQLRATARLDRPHSHFRRRTSAILRMVNLSWAISASFVFPRQRMPQLCKVSQRRFLWDQLIRSDSGACRPRIPNQADHRFRRPGKTGRHAIGTSGRHGPEQVDGIHRNRWSA
jgi:hypothetical protein